MNKEESKDIVKIINGVSISAVFIVLGIIFYFQPTFFYYEVLTAIMGLISITIGIVTLSFELSKINEDTVGFSDLGLGLGILVIWAMLYYYLPYVWINIIGVLLLFFGLYGTLSGAAKLLLGFINNKDSRGKIMIKSLLIFLQLVGFVSAVITIMSTI